MTEPAINLTDSVLPPDAMAGRAGRRALVTPDEEVDHATLLARVNQWANAFRALDLPNEARVAFIMRDDAALVAGYFGAIKAGLVAIALNNRLEPADIAHQIELADAGAIVVDPAFDDRLAAVPATRRAHGIVLGCGPREAWPATVVRQSTAFESVKRRPRDMAFWLFSSGTTGRPKAIVHSHKDGAGCALLLGAGYQRGADELVFCTSKLFFAFPMANALMGPLALGMATLLYPDWPDPTAVPDIVARHRPTVMMSVPTVYHRILREAGGRMDAFSTVGLFASAGERMPTAVWQAWKDATGHEIAEFYGNSESHCIVIASSPGDARPGVAGVAAPGAELRLDGPDGSPAPPGASGELWVRHPALATGYWDDVARTEAAFRDGWFRTGDMFAVDADGQWSHLGRADSMTRIAGQWVSPAEIVDAAMASGRCEEAACALVPDAAGFERLALFVVAPGADERALEADLAAGLPRFKRPRWIRFVDAIPKTPTGKVQAFRLREAFLAVAADGGA